MGFLNPTDRPTSFSTPMSDSLVLAGRVVNTGAYYIFQYYIPEWDIDRLRYTPWYQPCVNHCRRVVLGIRSLPSRITQNRSP